MDHVCATKSRRGLSCDTCGKYIRERLLTIAVKGFTGKDSTNDRVTAFLNTGEPQMLDKRVKVEGTGLSG